MIGRIYKVFEVITITALLAFGCIHLLITLFRALILIH
jgi:hypothetical protein